MDMTLVVMAAGLGSRYGGVKQIERLGPDGEILMEYAIYDALRAGFDRIVLIIKPQMLQDVRALFGDRIEQRTGMRIDYAFQTPERFTAARPELAQRQQAARHRARRAVRARCDPKRPSPSSTPTIFTAAAPSTPLPPRCRSCAARRTPPWSATG